MEKYRHLDEDGLTPLKSAVGAEIFEGKVELARKTLCSDCTKRTVCRYTGDFEKLLYQIDRLERQVHIHRVDVSCSEFEKTKTGFR